jgi:prefoldin alpha subunit
MSQMSLTKQPNLKQVDLTQLDLQQLTLFKQELDQSLEIFQDSLHSLKIAQNKFQESNDCLDKFTPDAKGMTYFKLFRFIKYKNIRIILSIF